MAGTGYKKPLPPPEHNRNTGTPTQPFGTANTDSASFFQPTRSKTMNPFFMLFATATLHPSVTSVRRTDNYGHMALKTYPTSPAWATTQFTPFGGGETLPE